MLLFRSVKKSLQSNGFDLCHPIHTAWYNHMIQNEGLIEGGVLNTLPEPSPSLLVDDAGDDDGCGENGGILFVYNAVLIGNTKAVWPYFINWLDMKVEERKRRQDIIRSGGDGIIIEAQHEMAVEDVIHSSPFDTYCEESISRSLQELCYRLDDASNNNIKSYELFWSNGKRQKFTTNKPPQSSLSSNGRLFSGEEQNDIAKNDAQLEKEEQHHCCNNIKQDSFLVSMQRIASITGQYWHDDENTKLCVHPVYGTWTAFRVLVIFEAESVDSNVIRGVIPSAPPPCPCPVTEEERKEAKKIFDYALEMNKSEDQKGDSSNNVGSSSYGTQSNKSWDELCTFLHHQVCQGSDWGEVPESMKPWIELRNSISAGRNEWKYDDAQLLYHYTKDPQILRRVLFKRVLAQDDTMR